MQILCQYNQSMQLFLCHTVEYVLEYYGSNLQLDKLKAIELVPKETFSYATDGKTCEKGTKIIVTSQLYELLPTLNITNLHDNPNFKMIINTLYHEMGHVNDWLQMPILYSIVEEMDDAKHALPGLIWLEYIAEKRSCSTNLVPYTEFCDDFVSRRWNSNQFDYQQANERNFYYLIKSIPYFLARTLDSNLRLNYLSRMKNLLLKQFIEEIDTELYRLEHIPFFDTPKELEPLYLILDTYFRKFRSTFK